MPNQLAVLVGITAHDERDTRVYATDSCFGDEARGVEATGRELHEVPETGAFLLLLGPSGKVWWAQTGGMLCRQRMDEGILIPFPFDAGSISYCCEPDLDVVVEQLQPWGWEIDTTRESEEAWIAVRAGAARGWLVYENCD